MIVETHAMPSHHKIMRFHTKALGRKRLMKAGPLPLPWCDDMESCGARQFLQRGATTPHHAMALAWVQTKVTSSHYHFAAVYKRHRKAWGEELLMTGEWAKRIL